jgi:hypothetical protein
MRLERVAAANRDRLTTHGMCYTPTFRSWGMMLNRCRNPKADNFKHYGGRGITVCERWLKFENFLVDMGERPEGTSLDRYPDTNGNYETGNCRWTSMRNQARNKRSCRFVTHEGQTKTVVEWAEILGIKASAIYARLSRGLPVERALAILDLRR